MHGGEAGGHRLDSHKCTRAHRSLLRTVSPQERSEREPFKSAPRKRRLCYEYRFDSSQEANIQGGSAIVLRDDLDGGKPDGRSEGYFDSR